MNPAERRRAFARAHIRDARKRGPVPVYGSEQWLALDAADPRRWAAIIVAAEAWTEDGDNLPANLARQVADQRDAEDNEHAAQFAATAQQVRDNAGQPTIVELALRRRDITEHQADALRDEWQRWREGHRTTAPGLGRRA